MYEFFENYADFVIAPTNRIEAANDQNLISISGKI